MDHLNLKYGDLVKIKGIISEHNGATVRVVGVASRNVIDTYIVEFLEDAVRMYSDGYAFSAFCMPESCLEPTE